MLDVLRTTRSENEYFRIEYKQSSAKRWHASRYVRFGGKAYMRFRTRESRQRYRLPRQVAKSNHLIAMYP